MPSSTYLLVVRLSRMKLIKLSSEIRLFMHQFEGVTSIVSKHKPLPHSEYGFGC